jgi:hypothetical protein
VDTAPIKEWAHGTEKGRNPARCQWSQGLLWAGGLQQLRTLRAVDGLSYPAGKHRGPASIPAPKSAPGKHCCPANTQDARRPSSQDGLRQRDEDRCCPLERRPSPRPPRVISSSHMLPGTIHQAAMLTDTPALWWREVWALWETRSVHLCISALCIFVGEPLLCLPLLCRASTPRPLSPARLPPPGDPPYLLSPPGLAGPPWEVTWSGLAPPWLPVSPMCPGEDLSTSGYTQPISRSRVHSPGHTV